MKKIFTFILLLLLLGVTYYYKEDIATFAAKHFTNEKVASTVVYNNYSFAYEFKYVKLTDDFTPESKTDIINIFYTVLNSGMSDFTFYCGYDECMNDVDAVSKDKALLSNINNFVHPYNSFANIETSRYTSTNQVDINITYTYNSSMINSINKKVDEVIKENINSDMKTEDKIKVIHDYIINNSKYDTLKSDSNISTYSSNTAYGPLFEGYAICNGYSDLMEIFLYRLDIECIKISSENHIWNLVNIDNKWYHLDLTWDDPVVDSGKDIVDYSYFLITNDELLELNDDQHFYDKNIYLEAN